MLSASKLIISACPGSCKYFRSFNEYCLRNKGNVLLMVVSVALVVTLLEIIY